jgi:23S rRNA maturation mini-RNase III
MHDYLRTVVVAPMTTRSRALTKKVGVVSAKTLASTLSTLREVFTE